MAPPWESAGELRDAALMDDRAPAPALRELARALLAIALLSTAGSVGAWNNHALGTWQALAGLPAVAAAPPVRVESLESFLEAASTGLDEVLERDEQWARANVPAYPPRPDALKFEPGGTPAQLRQRFLGALRVNPGARLTLFLQVPPGVDTGDAPTLPWTEVTTMRHETAASETKFLLLHEGDSVPVLDVVASASDEPDYGFDIGLWANNGTAYGKIYGFGTQPFGNPALENSSQGPFHLGYFHESPIVYQAAGFLRRTYPEYRIHLYRALASYADRTGHSYWAWRFAGWALHYVQDLTQPYHARVLPGVSMPRMLWINTLDLLHYPARKDRAIRLVSNRHLALENYQFRRMRDAYQRHDFGDALLRAIRDPSIDAGYRVYSDKVVREVVSREAHAAADATDRTLEHSLPPKYISDPGYVFSETETGVDLFTLLAQSPTAAQREMESMVAMLMGHFGAHSRAFVGSLFTR
jgi:hypothetical protein